MYTFFPSYISLYPSVRAHNKSKEPVVFFFFFANITPPLPFFRDHFTCVLLFPWT